MQYCRLKSRSFSSAAFTNVQNAPRPNAFIERSERCAIAVHASSTMCTWGRYGGAVCVRAVHYFTFTFTFAQANAEGTYTSCGTQRVPYRYSEYCVPRVPRYHKSQNNTLVPVRSKRPSSMLIVGIQGNVLARALP